MYGLMDKSVTGSDVYNIKRRDEIKTTFEQRELIIVDMMNGGKQSLTLAEIQKHAGYKRRDSARRLALRMVENNPDKL